MKVKQMQEKHESDVLHVCVRPEPGPNMRWFEQGFFMGLGLCVAVTTISLSVGIIGMVLIAVATGGK